MSRDRIFPLAHATGERVEAPVLVSPVSFSARYDLDRVSGEFSRIGHPLKGETLAGKILVAPDVQGGVAAGWALLAMKGRGVGVAGLLFGATNPVMVQGAVTAGIPIAAGVGPELFQLLGTGDLVRLDPSSKTLTILSSYLT